MKTLIIVVCIIILRIFDINIIKIDSIMTLVFQSITALGSLATFGAFFMLFRKDKNKQSQIEKLTSIAATLGMQSESLKKRNDLLEQRLRLSVKPNLWTNGGLQDENQRRLEIDLSNKGETARLIDFRLDSTDVELRDVFLPYDLDKGMNIFIYANPITDKRIENCEYELYVIYSDALDNEYCLKFKGKGSVAKIVETTKL